jgi:hypothetical protein
MLAIRDVKSRAGLARIGMGQAYWQEPAWGRLGKTWHVKNPFVSRDLGHAFLQNKSNRPGKEEGRSSDPWAWQGQALARQEEGWRKNLPLDTGLRGKNRQGKKKRQQELSPLGRACMAWHGTARQQKNARRKNSGILTGPARGAHGSHRLVAASCKARLHASFRQRLATGHGNKNSRQGGQELSPLGMSWGSSTSAGHQRPLTGSRAQTSPPIMSASDSRSGMRVISWACSKAREGAVTT